MITYSIIVVSYQAGKQLYETVDSILQQTYPSYEIIIKDGGSTDGSIENIASLQKDNRVFLYQEQDAGIYDAMNQGISYATGDYVLFLNCGDRFYQDTVLEQVTHAIEGEKEALYYGDVFHEGAGSLDSMPRAISPFTCYRHMPCHQGMLYRREVLQGRGYQCQYRVRGDYEHFLWAYFEKGIRPKALDLIIASYEGGGYSESKVNEERDRWEHREITKKYIPPGKLVLYRGIMVITLVPLRRRIARSKRYSNIYNQLKQRLYHRK
ncbi:MAG: glycosyltransferase family 2 protein [Eubacteriales bacterium]